MTTDAAIPTMNHPNAHGNINSAMPTATKTHSAVRSGSSFRTSVPGSTSNPAKAPRTSKETPKTNKNLKNTGLAVLVHKRSTSPANQRPANNPAPHLPNLTPLSGHVNPSIAANRSAASLLRSPPPSSAHQLNASIQNKPFYLARRKRPMLRNTRKNRNCSTWNLADAEPRLGDAHR